jgi:PAS domain S-box-containing protein
MLSPEIFPAVLESPAQGILVADREGTIVFCNSTVGRLFGYAPDELAGASVDMLLPESMRAAHAAHRERFTVSPSVRPMGAGVELSGRRKDGTEFPVEVSLNSLQSDMGPLVVAFVADISARKEMEEQVARAQRMEALGLLSAGLAHDFNNLLTIIMGHLHESMERLPTGNALRDSAKSALSATDQAAQLVRQLLAFARPVAAAAGPVNLNLVISENELLLRRLAGSAEFVVQLDPDPCEVVATREEIERAVMNLVANARDAIKPGGWILIETRRVDLDSNPDPASMARQTRPYAMLSVSDNGSGMTPEVQQRIFDPFFTTKEKGRGAGLGLALVYAAVKRAAGEIRVHSELGKGTSCKLFLPRVVRNVREGPEDPARASGTETVLVVDDHAAVLQTTAAMLQSLNYTVITAGSGVEAVAVSRSYAGSIDILLTDVLMPGMSGPELAHKLTGERPGMRVVFMSGYTSGSVARHGLFDAGAVFLAKPFTVDSLAATMGGPASRGRSR